MLSLHMCATQWHMNTTRTQSHDHVGGLPLPTATIPHALTSRPHTSTSTHPHTRTAHHIPTFISSTGYPSVLSLDILDNVVPYIGGEEDKLKWELKKILGGMCDEGYA